MQKHPWMKVALTALGLLLLWGGLLGAAGAAETVAFADPALEAAVREQFGLSDGPIAPADLLAETRLEAVDLGIESLAGLEYCTGLVEIDFSYNRISDLSPLSGLPVLREAVLTGNQISDLTPLAGMTIKKLHLRENQVTDIGVLSTLTNLTNLNLRENDVADISPLAGLTGMKKLNLHSNSRVASIQPIAGMTRLEELVLRDVYVGKNIELIRPMLGLYHLNLRNCGIEDISAVLELMRVGALQDRPGEIAEVNLMQNEVLFKTRRDQLEQLKPYWEHVTARAPTSLLQLSTGALEAPSFSVPGGFYQEALEVSLACVEGASIHYTLDGTEPTAMSALYAQPIPLELADADAGAPQATVLRAIAVGPGGASSGISTQTYLLHPEGQALYSFPVLALTVSPKYLYDEEYGIYTEAYQEESGDKWERPAHLEFYETDGSQALSQNLGVRIHGGLSRSYTQKSLRLRASFMYDEKNRMEHAIFPGQKNRDDSEAIDSFSSLLLRNSGNDLYGLFFKDAYAQSLVSHLKTFETQAFRPAIVFLNGEYWGIYNMREYQDAEYLASHFGMPAQEAAVLDYDASVREGGPSDRQDYLALCASLLQEDVNTDEAYRRIQEQIDVRSLAEYYAANVFFGNVDWPFQNIRFWRRNPAGGTPTPWRMLLFDVDDGFQNDFGVGPDWDYWRTRYENEFYQLTGGENDNLAFALDAAGQRGDAVWGGFLFQHLIKNEQFRNLFFNSMDDFMNSCFQTDRMMAQLDAFIALYEVEMPRHIDRWAHVESMEQWRATIELLQAFLEQRSGAIRTQFEAYFGLVGSVRVYTFADPEQGYVVVNHLEIREETPGIEDAEEWMGFYFRNVPIQVTAVPAPGYVFDGWLEYEEMDASLTVLPEEDLYFTPIFLEE